MGNVDVKNNDKGLMAKAQACYRDQEHRLLAVKISEEQAEKFLEGSEAENEKDVWDPEWLQDKMELLRKEECQFLLMQWGEHEEKYLLFFSDTKQVRPLEFLDYLVSDFGLVRGNAFCASVQVSAVILQLQMTGQGIDKTLDYLVNRSESYFRDCDWIVAAEYGQIHAEEIKKLPFFHKRKIAWAYVKTTDMVSAGKTLRIKSLENESGLEIVAAEDTYIMIGCRGEVYDIRRHKFENSYEITEEPLDVFEQMMDFWPEVQMLPEREFLSIDQYAHLCYPKPGAGIYARRLEKRTKIFPVGEGHEYFLGREGDYMAVRPDDLTDIYVIRGDIFEQTYEEN